MLCNYTSKLETIIIQGVSYITKILGLDLMYKTWKSLTKNVFFFSMKTNNFSVQNGELNFKQAAGVERFSM